MALHFSRFIKKGWAFVESACAGDGKAGGDGHSIVDATYSYMTCTDTSTGDYSTVITNSTDSPIAYTFKMRGTEKSENPVNIWETKGPSGGKWNENYFRLRETITPEHGSFTVTVQPYSVITLTTLEIERGEFKEYESKLLPLPYSDDLEYNDEYLTARGGAPRYTTDEGGAFEVVEADGNKVLMQKITEDIHAVEWGATPAPVTNFGDDRWFNYSVSADVKFGDSEDPAKCFVGVGLRYNLADSGASGWNVLLYANGVTELRIGDKVVAHLCREESVLANEWNNISVEAVNDTVRCYINNEAVSAYGEHGDVYYRQPAGRAALYSSYHNNCFDNVRVAPTYGENTYIKRLNNTDESITYSGDWSHDLMSSFRNYKRTTSSGNEGASFTIGFDGTGIMLVGEEKGGAVIDTELDGAVLNSEYAVPKTDSRSSFYAVYGLENKHHTLKVIIKKGSMTLDSAEVILDNSESAKHLSPTVSFEQE